MSAHTGSCEGDGRLWPFHGFVVGADFALTCPCCAYPSTCPACLSQDASGQHRAQLLPMEARPSIFRAPTLVPANNNIVLLGEAKGQAYSFRRVFSPKPRRDDWLGSDLSSTENSDEEQAADNSPWYPPVWQSGESPMERRQQQPGTCYFFSGFGFLLSKHLKNRSESSIPNYFVI